MPFGVLRETPGVTEEEYLTVERNLGPDRPPGLLAHVAGPVEWLIEIGPAGAAYRDAAPPRRAAARAGAARLPARFREPASGYRLPAGIWLITATAP